MLPTPRVHSSPAGKAPQRGAGRSRRVMRSQLRCLEMPKREAGALRYSVEGARGSPASS
jgi:hypothetical protein